MQRSLRRLRARLARASDPAISRMFVFISMLAYSAQELLFEPFAGLVFGLPLGAVGAAFRTLARLGARAA